MNKVYKLKFNRETQDLVAVSELATNAVAGATTSDTKVSSSESLTHKLHSLATRVRNWGVFTGVLLGCGVALSLSAQAHTGAQVVAGAATIVTEANVTTITNTPNTIINWQQFNIGSNELVEFIQESSNSAVLNRVLGNSVSEILGTLKSNGKVFLINPNGILFGANAVVDTNSLVASTLNLSDADFQAGKYVFNQEKDQAIASVLNQGLIKVQKDGTLALVGGNVVNTGILEAKNGSVYLLAGQSIQIADLNNPLISFKVTAGNKAVNLGEIVAKNVTMLANAVNHGRDDTAQAFVDLYSGATSTESRITASGQVELFAGSVAPQPQSTAQSNAQVTGNRNGLAVVNGVIEVANAQGQAGSVEVLADQVRIGEATVINATGVRGGTVLLGGDYQGTGTRKLASMTRVEPHASVDVSGTAQAGTAVVWGDRAEVSGNFRATSVTGNGGLIETSGKSIQIGEQIQVNTTSLYGSRGNWLIDPEHLVILAKPTNGGTSGINSGKEIAEDSPATPNNGGKSYGATVTDPVQTIEFIYNSTIESALTTTDVTLHATSCITGQRFTITETNKSHGLTLNAASVVLTDVNIAIGSFNVTSSEKEGAAIDLLNATFDVKKFNITGPSKVNITGGSVINATEELVVNSSNGSLLIEQANLSLTDTNPPVSGISLKAEGNVNLNDINVAGVNFSVESTNGSITADYVRNNLTGTVNFSGKSGVSLTETYLGAAKDRTTSAATSTTPAPAPSPVNNVTINSSAGKVKIQAAKFNTTESVIIDGAQGVEVSRTDFEAAKKVTVNSTAGGVSITGRTLNASEEVNVSAQGNVVVDGVQVTTKKLAVESTNSSTEVKAANLTVSDSSGTVTIKGNQSAKVQGGTLNSAGAVTVESTEGAVAVNGTKVNANQATVTLQGKTEVNLSNNAHVEAKDFKANSSLVSIVNSAVETTAALELGNSTQALNQLVLSGATVTAGIKKAEFDSKFATTPASPASPPGVNLSINANQANVTNSNLGASDSIQVTTTNDLNLGGKVLAQNFTANSTNGAITLNQTQAKVAENLGVNSANGAVKLQDTQLHGKAVNVTSNTALTATNSNFTGENLTLESSNQGEVQLANVAANTTSGELKVKATNGSITVQGNSNLTSAAAVDLSIGSPSQGNITVANSQVNATGELKVNTSATANFSAANVSATSLTSDGTQEFIVTGTQLTTTNGLTVNSTQLTVTNGATLNSTAGEITLNATTTQISGANLQGNSKVTLKGNQITVNNTTTLNSKDVVVDASDAVVLENTQLTATEAKLNATAKTLTLTNVSSAAELSDLTVKGNESLTLQDTGLSAKTITGSSDGTVLIANSSLNATDAFNVSGQEKVEVTSGSQLKSQASTGLVLESKNATVAVTDAQLNSTHCVTLQGAQGTTLNNASIDADQVALVQDGKDLTIKGGAINVAEDITLNTSGKITLSDGAELNTQKALDINSTGSSVEIVNATFTAQEQASIAGSTGLQLNNITLEATEVNVTSQATAQIQDTILVATATNLSVTAKDNLTISGNNAFEADQDHNVVVNATDGMLEVSGLDLGGQNVTLTGHTGVNLTAVSGELTGDLKVAATSNDVNVTGSGIIANNVSFQGANVQTNNSLFQVQQEFNATVAGDAGNLALSNTTVNATATEDAQVILSTKAGNLSLDSGSQVIATQGVDLNTTGTLTVSDSKLTSQTAQVTLNATKVELQQATVTAAQAVNVTSSDEQGLKVQGSTLNSETQVTLNNTHGVAIQSSNLNATQEVTVSAADASVELDGVVMNATNATLSAQGITATGLHTTGTDLTLQADNATVSNSYLNNAGNVTVAATYNATVSDSTLAATNVTLHSEVEGDVALQGSTVDATNLSVNATQGGALVAHSNLNVTTGAVTATSPVVVDHNRVQVSGSLTLSSATSLDLVHNKGKSNQLILNYPEESASRAQYNSWSWNERVNPLVEENPVLELDGNATSLAQGLELEDTPAPSWEDERVRMHQAALATNEFNALLANPTHVVLTSDAQGLSVATVPVQLALATCSTAGQALIAKHAISATDLSSLSPLELQRKYQLTAQELATLIQSCQSN